jgi:predicted MFS family arabinose efflux permease
VSFPLPAPARRLIASVFVTSIGTGLTLPFTLILLHEVRGIALPTVGLLLAVPGVVGIAVVPASGALIDRLGPRTVLRVALALAATGNLVLAYCDSVATALPAMVLIGAGLSPTFPAVAALLNGLVDGPEQVQRAFGVNFTALNAAIGIGGIIGAAVIDVSSPATFEALYIANAASFAVQWLMLPAARPRVREEDEVEGSYREVLADPTMVRVVTVSLLLALTGYAALDSGLPAFARVVGHVPPSSIALAFAVNTAVIVAGQLALLRVIVGRSRSKMLAVTAATWALSWALLGLVPGLPAGGRTFVVLLFGGVFGLGECFMAPTLQPLINALATDRLRGRYNALSSAAFSVAFVVSPAISGALIGNGLGTTWLTGIVVLSLIAATVAVQLSRRLSPSQDGLTAVPVPG